MIEFKNYYDVPKDFTGVCKLSYDLSICYFQDRTYHREDGPAIIESNGKEYWFINGKRHREDGAAIIYKSGYKEFWYKNKCYGTNNSFNIKTWKKKVKELKYLESLEIFK